MSCTDKNMSQQHYRFYDEGDFFSFLIFTEMFWLFLVHLANIDIFQIHPSTKLFKWKTFAEMWMSKCCTCKLSILFKIELQMDFTLKLFRINVNFNLEIINQPQSSQFKTKCIFILLAMKLQWNTKICKSNQIQELKSKDIL